MCYLISLRLIRREDPRDCVVLHEKYAGLNLKTLPEGSLIGELKFCNYLFVFDMCTISNWSFIPGTSSLRRTAQICHKFPHLKVRSIRGNLNTRMRKLNEGLFDGIVLAVAGIERMNWKDKISEVVHLMPY